MFLDERGVFHLWRLILFFHVLLYRRVVCLFVLGVFVLLYLVAFLVVVLFRLVYVPFAPMVG